MNHPDNTKYLAARHNGGMNEVDMCIDALHELSAEAKVEETSGKMPSMSNPEFCAAKNGYNMCEVDTYIDTLRTENEALVQTNNELFNLWATEIQNIDESELEGNVSEFDLSKLCHLMDLSKKYVTQNNHPPAPVKTEKARVPKKHSRLFSTVKGILFYSILILVVLGAFLFSGSPTDPPQNVAGFSAMTVLTRSMQSVLPQHSLIITRRADPDTIQIGENISFLMPNNMSVTHQVVAIEENYQNTGMRGFVTQGVDNADPDIEIVLAQNVIGRVIFHNLMMGKAISLMRENIVFAGIALGSIILIAVIIHSLRKMFSKSGDTTHV